MRTRALAPIVLLASILLGARAAAADEPLICYETGVLWVGPIGPVPYWEYDPPDPCVL